jgi:hypothetical protein
VGTKVIKGAMNSKFSSNVTPETVEKLKKFNEEFSFLESKKRMDLIYRNWRWILILA